MAGRLREKPATVFDGSHLLVGCGKIQPPEARKRNRPGAHGAGLQRHIDIAVNQPLGVQQRGGGADRQHLGMGGGVFQFQRAIAGAGEDASCLVSDDSTDRHLAPGGGGLGFLEGEQHWLWQFQSHRAR